MSKNPQYSKKQQKEFREWLELSDRPRNLGRIQIYENIDITDQNKHQPVSIDEEGNLYVGDDIVLTNKKRIPNACHNIYWGLSHTPYRQLYGLQSPYSRFTYVKSPVDVHDLNKIFEFSVNSREFWIAYWFSFVLHQRELLLNYILTNNRRLKWLGEYADPDFRKRKSLFIFPRN